MNTAKLLEHFNEIDVRKRGELRFDDFSRLYMKLLGLDPMVKYIITHPYYKM